VDAQGQAQIVLVLVAVADEKSLSGQAQGESGEQFRLGSYLQADAVFGPVFDDIFNDLFSLIDLHGKDGLVGALVGELFNRGQKSAGDLIYSVLQDLGKAEEDGKLQVFGLFYLLYQIHDIHR